MALETPPTDERGTNSLKGSKHGRRDPSWQTQKAGDPNRGVVQPGRSTVVRSRSYTDDFNGKFTASSCGVKLAPTTHRQYSEQAFIR